MTKTKALLPSIGQIYQVDLTRTLAVSDLGYGWRACKASAGGGVLGDLGWHTLDNLIEFNLINERSEILQFEPLITHPKGGYDCEDTCYLTLRNTASEGSLQPVIVYATISRVGKSKANRCTFRGRHGTLTVEDDDAILQFFDERGAARISFESESRDDMLSMFKSSNDLLQGHGGEVDYEKYLEQDRTVTGLISRIYASRDASPSITQWPVITAATQNAVVEQLQKTISVYSNDGIVGQLEERWKSVHGQPEWHALLHNSGTNALHGLFASARLKRGDEVIFPVYTFHATCSPAMQYGVSPVFCDCDETGNIDPRKLEVLITVRTKAVIVTHMWGTPCDMAAILEIVRRTPRVMLFEDCSHAHGATINGQLVGTFGDGAAWSLQGPKIIPGGEGGILLTRHKDVFDMALLNGHYNKRCFKELSPTFDLRSFAGTGVGFKHRSHPLANAIALQQVDHLGSFLSVKRTVAGMITQCLADIPFLEVPTLRLDVQPAWYAYVARYKGNLAPGRVNRDSFFKALVKAGVTIIDIPRSTGLVAREPLFSRPSALLPHLYDDNQVYEHGSFPVASCFYDEALKFDVCAIDTQISFMANQLALVSKVARALADLVNTLLRTDWHR